MPWNKNDYPASFKNLEPDVRNKAIEIANALLEEGYDDGRAIPIAMSKAREYVHGDDGNRPEYEVVSKSDQWIFKKVDGERAIFKNETKTELLEKAKPYVNEQNGVLNIYHEDGSHEDTLYD
jgi:uncharacterized protein YdaT